MKKSLSLLLAVLPLFGAAAGAGLAASVRGPSSKDPFDGRMCFGSPGPLQAKLALSPSGSGANAAVEVKHSLGGDASVAYGVEVLGTDFQRKSALTATPQRVATGAAQTAQERVNTLGDGYYLVRLTVAAATAGDDAIGASDTGYLQVACGRASVITASEFFKSSGANQGRRTN